MKLPGDKPKEKAAYLASVLPVGKSCIVQFGKHKDTAELKEVRVSTQKEIKDAGGNLPDKRRGPDGKEYTPTVISMIFKGFTLDIVEEDIDLELRIAGAVIHMAWGNIIIQENK